MMQTKLLQVETAKLNDESGVMIGLVVIATAVLGVWYFSPDTG
jgi:hypothetical protein